jgi:hypothetical protein
MKLLGALSRVIGFGLHGPYRNSMGGSVSGIPLVAHGTNSAAFERATKKQRHLVCDRWLVDVRKCDGWLVDVNEEGENGKGVYLSRFE